MWRRAAFYGLALAAGTGLLQWLDYRRLVRAQSETVYVVIVALGFLALGVWAGVRLLGHRAPPAPPFDGNPQAQAALGISPREREVLEHLAAGLSNKEIADRLNVSPHTVKTHVARLFEKLGARRRTEAILKARELGLLR
jgi:DNA-binding CsgD family transcriptional regulator